MLKFLTAIALGSLLALAAGTVPLSNPAFEEADDSGMPTHWGMIGPGDYEITVDESFPKEGARSLRIRGEGNFTGLVQTVSPEPFRGHGLVLTGWIRTEEVASYSGFWVRLDSEGQMVELDNMSDRGPRGTGDWQRVEVRMAVPEAVDRILVGPIMGGAGTAWYDDIRLAVDSTVTAPDWEPEPLGPPDTTLQDERPEWVRAAAEAGRPLRSLTDDRDFSDLAFLPGLVGDRRVVQLGESGHGVAEFNETKVRLIKYLHREMGFDVVAFESSLFGCWEAQRNAHRLTAEELMEHCIFGVWHTDEVLELFRYIRSTHGTDRPLRVAGFDTQTSSQAGPEARPGFWREVLGPLDPDRAGSAAALDSTFLALRRRADDLAPRAEELVAGYRALEAYLADRADTLRALHTDAPEKVAVAERLAASGAHHVEQLTASGAARTLARDGGMADNLLFLMDRLYPDSRIITWGHNFHLRHANERADGASVRTMGQWMAEARRGELYTVGLYMRRGRAALNNRNVYNIEPPGPGSLESILGHALREMDGAPALFLDLGETAERPGGGWVDAALVTHQWGRSMLNLVPREQYDAILFVDEVRPPSYR